MEFFKLAQNDIRAKQCPFCNHSSQNRAFSINPLKGVFKCHSCSQSGHVDQLKTQFGWVLPVNIQSTEYTTSSKKSPLEKANAIWEGANRDDFVMEYLNSRCIPQAAFGDLVGEVLRGGECAFKIGNSYQSIPCLIFRLGTGLNRIPIVPELRKQAGKRFYGSPSEACYFGDPRADQLLVFEGIENALSIRSLVAYKNCRFAVVGNSGNLKGFTPDREYQGIRIFADDDWRLPKNVGLEAAEQCARRIGAVVVKPKRYDRPQDWNDLLVEGVLEGAIEEIIPSPSFIENQEIAELTDYIYENSFPNGVLPPLVEEYLQKKAMILDINFSSMALCFLGLVAVAAGGRKEAVLKSLDFSVRPILWVACVGKTGVGKTAMLNFAGLNWIRNYQNQIIRAFKEKEDLFKRNLNLWQSLDRDGRLQQFPNGKPIEPDKPKQFYSQISTVETILELNDSNAAGCSYVNDELATVLDGRNQYKGGGGNDQSVLLDAWNGKGIVCNVKGVIRYIENSAIGMVGGIQPPLLKKIIDNRSMNDGFAARFLFAFIEQSAHPIHTREAVKIQASITGEHISTMEGIFHRLIDNRSVDETFEFQEPSTVPEDFIYQVKCLTRQEDSFLESAKAKLCTYYLRICLVLHLIQGGRGTISQKTMMDAELVTDWVWKNSLQAYHHVFRSENQDRYSAIIEKLKTMGGTANKENLRQALKRKVPYLESGRLIDELIRWGVLLELKKGTVSVSQKRM